MGDTINRRDVLSGAGLAAIATAIPIPAFAKLEPPAIVGICLTKHIWRFMRPDQVEWYFQRRFVGDYDWVTSFQKDAVLTTRVLRSGAEANAFIRELTNELRSGPAWGRFNIHCIEGHMLVRYTEW